MEGLFQFHGSHGLESADLRAAESAALPRRVRPREPARLTGGSGRPQPRAFAGAPNDTDGEWVARCDERTPGWRGVRCRAFLYGTIAGKVRAMSLVIPRPPGQKKNSRQAFGRLAWPLSRPGHPMPTKGRSSSVAAPHVADAGFLRACRAAAEMSPDDLRAAAIARGCSHYAPLWPKLTAADRAGLPHEALGCALLRGPANAETFQSIRCGAMVLSDLGNSAELIAAAAEELGVAGRVAHVVRLGLSADVHPEFWTLVRAALPELAADEQDFLPGVSRLVTETRLSGPGKGPGRTWLRTQFRR